MCIVCILQEHLIQPSVPELTLLCDGQLGMSSTTTPQQSCKSNVTVGRDTPEQMQAAASCAAANGSIDAVSSSDHLSSTSCLQPLTQSSTNKQLTVRQPPMINKLYQLQVDTNTDEENNAASCCHHCSSAQYIPSVDGHIPGNCGGDQNGTHRVSHSIDNSNHGCMSAYPPANLPVQSFVVPNSKSSPHLCAVSTRMQSVSTQEAVSSAARIPMQCHCRCSQQEQVTMAVQNMHPSVAHNGLQHKAIDSSSLYEGQLVTSQPRWNDQYHQYSQPYQPRFQTSHQHSSPYEAQSIGMSGEKTGCCGQNHQMISRHPVMPVRFPSPASRQTSPAIVSRQVQQPYSVPRTRSSRLPLKVKSASQAAVRQSNSQQYVSLVSPPVVSNVMQCNETHQPYISVPVTSQHGELPGGSKAIHFSKQPGAQLLGPQSDTPVSQQCVAYNSERYSSHGKSASVSYSQHEYQIDLQKPPSYSSTPVVSVPVSGGPSTVSDLLSTIPLQNIDWSVTLPQDIATVDGFVESVLGHKSASTDSGLQVNDSAASGETPPKTSAPLATDNCNSILSDVGDCETRRKDRISQHSMNIKNSANGDIRSDLGGHLGYVQEKPEITEKSSLHNDRPKLCSVAVNTSLYWPPADNERTQRQHIVPSTDRVSLLDARCLNSADDNTAQPANDIAVLDRGCAVSGSTSGVTVSERPLISDRDIELVSGHSPGMCDSMVDVSLGTPPPPVLPNPSEESVVSEMIMDMPEYTALSHEQ